jgi:chromate transport protein ChrA
VTDHEPDPPPRHDPATAPLREVVLVFLKLGTIAFGGPAAHIAMMHEEVVRRRGWLDEQQFVDLVGATNLIPGPNSTELAIHLGYRRARWRGLVAAGVCFILPAFVIVLALAWAYVRYGRTPAVGGLLYGIKPVVVAIIGWVLLSLARTAVRGYVTGFNPAPLADRQALRAELGYRSGERVCVVTGGGSGVGGHLLRRVIAAYPEAKRRVPALRMVVVTGPRIDPGTLPRHEGLEVSTYVHELYRHLAACDLAVVQGGLTTCMELTAVGRPFLYFPSPTTSSRTSTSPTA